MKLGVPFHDEHNPSLYELVEQEAREDPEIVGPDDERPTVAELRADEDPPPRWRQRQNSNRTVGEGDAK